MHEVSTIMYENFSNVEFPPSPSPVVVVPTNFLLVLLSLLYLATDFFPRPFSHFFSAITFLFRRMFKGGSLVNRGYGQCDCCVFWIVVFSFIVRFCMIGLDTRDLQ